MTRRQASKTNTKSKRWANSLDNPYVWLLFCATVLGSCHYTMAVFTGAGL